MPLTDLKRPSCFKRFKLFEFIQVILEEGEDSFQRITCFNSRLLPEVVSTQNCKLDRARDFLGGL